MDAICITREFCSALEFAYKHSGFVTSSILALSKLFKLFDLVMVSHLLMIVLV